MLSPETSDLGSQGEKNITCDLDSSVIGDFIKCGERMKGKYWQGSGICYFRMEGVNMEN